MNEFEIITQYYGNHSEHISTVRISKYIKKSSNDPQQAYGSKCALITILILAFLVSCRNKIDSTVPQEECNSQTNSILTPHAIYLDAVASTH